MAEDVHERLRAIVRRHDARLAAVLAPHALGVGEWRVLALLNDAGAVAPSVLAERLGLTRGGVTKLIDRLRARRLLVRAGAGGPDRRYQTIALTGAGAVLVRDLTSVVGEAGRLGDADRVALMGVLAG